MGVVGVHGGACVSAREDSGGQAINQPAVGLMGESEVMALCKVAGMGGHQVEKLRFGVGVTEAADSCEVVGSNVHRE